MQFFLELIAMFIFYSLFAFSILVSILGVINLIFIKKPIVYSQNNISSLVSVLIPARNEEVNIKRCLYSLIDQSYKNLEIIVLDDDSDDQTYNIVKDVSKNFSSIKLIKGERKSNGWIQFFSSNQCNGSYIERNDKCRRCESKS